MALRQKLTPDEVGELFSELDDSGVGELADRRSGRKKRATKTRTRKKRVQIDPLSEQDPSKK